MCSRCGRPTGAVAIPAATLMEGVRPGSVTAATAILLLTWVFGLVSLATVIMRLGARISLTQSVLFSLLWILIIIMIWQRQNWARIAALVLLLVNIATLAFTLVRIAGSNVAWLGFAFPVGIDLLRIFAVYLLFRPQSTAWFKK